MFYCPYPGETRPPRFLVKPLDAIYLQGETAVLDCAAAGVPQPEIRWLKDGITIPIEYVKYSIGSFRALQLHSMLIRNV